MGILSVFRRKKGVVDGINEVALGMSDDGEEGEGGPHFFRTDLAQLRWAAQGAAVEVVNSDPDPLMWPNAQMVFDAERAIAFAHEGLRDRLSNKVAAELRDVVEDLYEYAAEIASTRVELEVVDEKLGMIGRTWREKFNEVENDPIELGRYCRHKNSTTRLFKGAVAILFVVSELVLTFKLFELALGIDNQPLLMLFSLGLLALFVVVPHFAAHGIKEGLTKHHTHLRQRYVDAKTRVPVAINRHHHMEEQDDKGFRWISMLSIVVLVLLIIPLSILRGSELQGGEGVGLWVWATLYFLLQLSISAYFFLREWLDHGYPSSTLFKIEQAKELLEDERSGLLEDLAEQVAEFNTEGQRIAFWVREAPRWDSYIVANYHQTVHYFRHTIAVGRPDLAPFVENATKPHLGRRNPEEEASRNLDSVANDMPSLDSAGLFDRSWWMEHASTALASLPDVQVESGVLVLPSSESDISWILSNSPAQVLAGFLEMLGVPFHYRKPSPLSDREPLDADSAGEPVAAPVVAADSGTIDRAATGAHVNGVVKPESNGSHPAPEETSTAAGGE